VQGHLPVKERKHDVVAVFGYTVDNGNEVWLGLKLTCKKKGTIKLQYLKAHAELPGVYLVTAATDMFTQNMIEHTFKKTVFVETVTYEAGRAGSRRRQKPKKPVVTVQIKMPLDPTIMADLAQQCSVRPPPGQSEDDDDDNDGEVVGIDGANDDEDSDAKDDDVNDGDDNDDEAPNTACSACTCMYYSASGTTSLCVDCRPKQITRNRRRQAVGV